MNYNKGEANRTPTYDVEDQYTTFILRPFVTSSVIDILTEEVTLINTISSLALTTKLPFSI